MVSKQWLRLQTEIDHLIAPAALPITYTTKNFVVIGSSSGADTIVGFSWIGSKNFYFATSHPAGVYVISIGY